MKGTAVKGARVTAALGCVLLLASLGCGATAQAATVSSGLLGGSDKEAGEAFTWSDDADCSKCHVKQAESYDKDATLISKHASLDCATCHEYAGNTDPVATAEADATAAKEAPATDTAKTAGDAATEEENPHLSMAEVHAGVTEVSTVKKSALVKTEISEGVCLTCHNKDDLAGATADSAVLTDANGMTINPHDIPASDQHATITCESCHIMHSNDTMAAYRACVSCHHAEVWECGTCHSYVAGNGIEK